MWSQFTLWHIACEKDLFCNRGKRTYLFVSYDGGNDSDENGYVVSQSTTDNSETISVY